MRGGGVQCSGKRGSAMVVEFNSEGRGIQLWRGRAHTQVLALQYHPLCPHGDRDSHPEGTAVTPPEAPSPDLNLHTQQYVSYC